MKKLCTIALFLLTFGTFSFAAEVNPLQSARELAAIQTSKNMMSAILKQQKGLIVDLILSVSPEKKERASALTAAVDNATDRLIAETMLYDTILDNMAEMYVATFTPEEIQQQLAFWKSPVGQKVIEKKDDLVSGLVFAGQKAFLSYRKDLFDYVNQEMSSPKPTE